MYWVMWGSTSARRAMSFLRSFSVKPMNTSTLSAQVAWPLRICFMVAVMRRMVSDSSFVGYGCSVRCAIFRFIWPSCS